MLFIYPSLDEHRTENENKNNKLNVYQNTIKKTHKNPTNKNQQKSNKKAMNCKN